VFSPKPIYPYFAFNMGVVTITVFLMVVGMWRDLPYYICPDCQSKFKPAFKNFMFSIKGLNKLMLTCPECGKKKYMEPLKDENAAQ
jgi:RNase P subunit RPR2